MAKYTTVTISGVATQVAKKTDIKGYTIGVIESFLPTDEELNKWSEAETDKWTEENNKRMEAICDFLNKSNL